MEWPPWSSSEVLDLANTDPLALAHRRKSLEAPETLEWAVSQTSTDPWAAVSAAVAVPVRWELESG